MGLSKKNTVIAIPLIYSGKSPEGIPCLPAGRRTAGQSTFLCFAW